MRAGKREIKNKKKPQTLCREEQRQADSKIHKRRRGSWERAKTVCTVTQRSKLNTAAMAQFLRQEEDSEAVSKR